MLFRWEGATILTDEQRPTVIRVGAFCGAQMGRIYAHVTFSSRKGTLRRGPHPCNKKGGRE